MAASTPPKCRSTCRRFRRWYTTDTWNSYCIPPPISGRRSSPPLRKSTAKPPPRPKSSLPPFSQNLGHNWNNRDSEISIWALNRPTWPNKKMSISWAENRPTWPGSNVKASGRHAGLLSAPVHYYRLNRSTSMTSPPRILKPSYSIFHAARSKPSFLWPGEEKAEFVPPHLQFSWRPSIFSSS